MLSVLSSLYSVRRLGGLRRLGVGFAFFSLLFACLLQNVGRAEEALSVESPGAKGDAASTSGRSDRPSSRLREARFQEKLQTQWPGTFLAIRLAGAGGLNGLPVAGRTPNSKGFFTDFHGGGELGVLVGGALQHFGAALSLEYAPFLLLPSPYSTPGSALRVGFDALWLPRGDWGLWVFEAGVSPWSVLRGVSEAGQGYVFNGIGYRLGARYRWVTMKKGDLELYFGIRAERFTQVDTGFAGSSKSFAIADFAGSAGEATTTVGLIGIQFNFRKE